MQEETSGGTTTINQYPNNNGWNGGPGWGWGAPYAAVPAYPAYGYGYGNGGFGGLDGLMRARSGDLRGIVNGIDYTVFDPANDPAIAAPYDADSFRTKKKKNKKALQIETGLDDDP